MFRVITCLAAEHDFRLVLLAAFVCVSTALTTFAVYSQAATGQKGRKFAWILLAGVCAGSGIWATHFVAMLAHNGGFPTAHEPIGTVTSLILAIVFSTVGFAVSSRSDTASVLAGALIVGASIGIMHYCGMRALEVPGHVAWNPVFVAVSWVFGLGLAPLAIWMFHQKIGRDAIVIGASLLTVAICGLHFTSMSGVTVIPDPTVDFVASDLNRPLLAMSISGVTFLVLLTSLSALAIQRSSARHEHELRAQNARFEAALRYLPVGLSMFDAEERLIISNRAFRTIYGLSDADVTPGTHFQEIMRTHTGIDPEECETVREQHIQTWLEAHKKKLEAGEAFSEVQRLNDGRVIRVSVGPVAGGGWVDLQEDITERSQQEEEIERLARHDILTGLANRSLLNERLEHALRMACETSSSLALLYLDLDRFKDVNDTLGHRAGDKLLIQVASRLRESVHKSDLIARVGGDEFVIIVSSDASISAVTSLAKRLIFSIGEHYDLDGQVVQIGTSVGIAISNSSKIDGQDLLAQADLALYNAKAKGRGTFSVFEESLDRRARQRRELEENLKLALENGEFTLDYQPFSTIETGELSGFEALLRWNHPVLGCVAPNDFIPIAEETGLISRIGDWVLRQACAEAAKWPPHLKIAVNLSPVQFKSPALVPSLIAAVAASGIKPERLEVEITESCLLHESDRVLDVLRSLHDFGVRITMDDFGTGCSSLSYLRSFPFDKIKIDRRFVSGLPDEEHCNAIMRSVCNLARALNLSVTAEGVEKADQLACLQEEGCNEIQGFLLGRPMSAGATRDLINGVPDRKVA